MLAECPCSKVMSGVLPVSSSLVEAGSLGFAWVVAVSFLLASDATGRTPCPFFVCACVSVHAHVCTHACFRVRVCVHMYMHAYGSEGSQIRGSLGCHPSGTIHLGFLRQRFSLTWSSSSRLDWSSSELQGPSIGIPSVPHHACLSHVAPVV